MRRSLFLALVVVVLTAAGWPWFISYRSAQARADALPDVAPVTADYLYRGELVSFWEGAVKDRVRNDMMSPRNLADQYLQRYRETGDIGDVLRALRMAQRSLDVMPTHNVAADLTMSSALLTLHRFREALRYVRIAQTYRHGDPSLVSREASLDLELGNYVAAGALLASVPVKAQLTSSEWQTVQARYDEITGHLGDARALLAQPAADLDANFSAPAQSRAWYHFREGELAFEAGDTKEALAQEHVALARFPTYADALRDLARFECAAHRWQECLSDATRSADLVPFPEALGYKADAQRGWATRRARRKRTTSSRRSSALAIANIYPDRLLAIYYSEHRLHSEDALRIARNELSVRDDIYTEDTLAWAAAMAGRWDEARRASDKAVRFNTEDSRLQYHAGIIALHFGERDVAKQRLTRALALNGAFHPLFADDARARLAKL